MAPDESTTIRDPIHGFIDVSPDELALIDSQPVQRLREIHQLALTYLVYPGATHRRFEHSLGVMHVAGQIFDVVAKQSNLIDRVRYVLPVETGSWKSDYWRLVLRLAALSHDIGHLPFSHGAETLLPSNKGHEWMTRRLIEGDTLRAVWQAMEPTPQPYQIARIATEPSLFPDHSFTDWEVVLNAMISGGFFGADRIDYLLRDSYHAGVAYGRFDLDRLIQSLRIIPENEEDGAKPVLGIKDGGLRSAEALLLARYSVFNQIYFHRTRRSFDIHLREFMKAWIDSTFDGMFPTDETTFLGLTDIEILAEIRRAAYDSTLPGHLPAKHIVDRQPHRCVWESNSGQLRARDEIGSELSNALKEAMKAEFGVKRVNIHHDSERPKRPSSWFPVLMRDGRIRSADNVSELLGVLPLGSFDRVYVGADPELRKGARRWIDLHGPTFERRTMTSDALDAH